MAKVRPKNDEELMKCSMSPKLVQYEPKDEPKYLQDGHLIPKWAQDGPKR